MPKPDHDRPCQSAAASAAVRDWPGYFDAVADAGPRETLVDAADRFAGEQATDPANPPLAVDLGCGTGRDTIELLRRGWRVMAVDGEAEALDRLLRRPEIAPYRGTDRLATRVVTFEELDPPPCLLLNASYALPFCPPEHFEALWRRIVTAIRPGGRFAGQLFGDEDDWAKLADRTHHAPDQFEALFRDFEIESLRTERYGPDPGATYPKRWHIYHVVARRSRQHPAHAPTSEARSPGR